MPPAIRAYEASQDLELWSFASAEAQIAAIADDIAYDAHDIDDGLRAELFALDDLAELPLVRGILGDIRDRHPTSTRFTLAHELVRRLITRMIEDVTAEAGGRLAALSPLAPMTCATPRLRSAASRRPWPRPIAPSRASSIRACIGTRASPAS